MNHLFLFNRINFKRKRMMIFVTIMSMDTFLAESLTISFENKFDKQLLTTIERELFTQCGLSIKQAMQQFHKLDEVLCKFLDYSDVQDLEMECLRKVCEIKYDDDDKKYVLNIKDQKLAQVLADSWFDKDNQIILSILLNSKSSLSIPKILDFYKLPKTSAYEKINLLIKNGILVEDGVFRTDTKQIIKKYHTVFDSLIVQSNANGLELKCQMRKKYVKTSTVIQVIDKKLI